MKERSNDDQDVVVFQWIQQLLGHNLTNGILPIPAPIVSRVFQELPNGNVHGACASQLSDVPLPFPYLRWPSSC